MPATLVSPTPESPYAVCGSNYAPLRPLTELGDREVEPCKLIEALQGRYEDYYKRDIGTWQEFWNTGRMVANLREGKLLLMRSVRDGSYLFAKREGKFSDNKTAGGLFQFYSSKLMAEWLSSRPERDPVCPSDEDQIEEFIAAVKVIQDYYDKRFFDDLYEQQESLSAQDFGTWITRFRYDPVIKDIVCELLEFPACRWDMRFRAEESPWFIYESKCSTGKLAHLLNANITPDDGGDHYGLQIVEQIAKQGSNVQGYGKEWNWGNANTETNESVVTEMWLTPDVYCDIVLDASEATVSGQTLPEGPLIETFPDGLVALGINGMRTIFAIYPENHKDHIVSGIYHLQSYSGVGKGISDSVDIQKDLNDLHSQTLKYVKTKSTPATAYMADLVTEDQARDIGKPGKVIALDFKNAPEGVTSVNQAIQTIEPQNPANAAFEYQEVLKGWLQLAMGVTDFSDGLPGVNNTTATGAKIGDANARMILVPQHRNKADHRKRADKVIYNLFRKYMDVPKFFATRDKNPITAGLTLTGTDFQDVDIDFEIVANSEVSKSPFAQAEAMAQILQYTGGVGGLIEAAQMNPDITGEIVNAFGAHLSIPNRDDIARVCRRRIEQAKKILDAEMRNIEMMSALGVPSNTADLPAMVVSKLMPPISPKELYPQQKAEWLADLLDSDELQYQRPELRNVVEAMIDAQLQAFSFGQLQVQLDQNAGAVIANAPMILGEQAMSSQNQAIEQQAQIADQQGQQQQAQQQGEQALQMEQQKAQIQEQQADAAHQRQMALSDRQHAQNVQLETMRNEGKQAA